ncbi:DegT/DnrJ/EryC1/StrS family aminotransferase [Streptomyces sp. NBC_00443]|uniref:DegT/DnrJ/EryC1/StrS family aminotransferase n=1 Tax=Streptomyces sp. NBC_00443 TaxID=2975743 RepID=UPI002E1BD184
MLLRVHGPRRGPGGSRRPPGRVGVATHVYYPHPLPAHRAFAPYAPPGARWPRAEQAARRHLALPVHHLLTDAQVEHVADLVCAFATEHR